MITCCKTLLGIQVGVVTQHHTCYGTNQCGAGCNLPRKPNIYHFPQIAQLIQHGQNRHQHFKKVCCCFNSELPECKPGKLPHRGSGDRARQPPGENVWLGFLVESHLGQDPWWGFWKACTVHMLMICPCLMMQNFATPKSSLQKQICRSSIEVKYYEFEPRCFGCLLWSSEWYQHQTQAV